MTMRIFIYVAFSLVVAALAAQAGPRTSAHYAIAAETLDAGGGRSSSANYASVASTGAIGSISTAAASAAALKAGYAAQLYDVNGLLVSASSSFVKRKIAGAIEGGAVSR